jgi:hypothetical protein
MAVALTKSPRPGDYPERSSNSFVPFSALAIAGRGAWHMHDTRWAACSTCAGFAAATTCNLKAGEPVWLTAAYFALMFGTIAITGRGRWSVDQWRHDLELPAALAIR